MTSAEFHQFYLPMAYMAAALAVIVVLAVFAGRVAESKGYSFGLFFALSMAAPLLIWILLPFLPDKASPKKVSAELQMAIELEKARMNLAGKAAKS